jgi:hypothetical protein
MQAIHRQLQQTNVYGLSSIDVEVAKSAIRQLSNAPTKDDYLRLLPEAKRLLFTVGKDHALLNWLCTYYIELNSRYDFLAFASYMFDVYLREGRAILTYFDARSFRFPPTQWAAFSFDIPGTRTNNIIESFHNKIKADYGTGQRTVQLIANLHSYSLYWQKQIAVLDQQAIQSSSSGLCSCSSSPTHVHWFCIAGCYVQDCLSSKPFKR